MAAACVVPAPKRSGRRARDMARRFRSIPSRAAALRRSQPSDGCAKRPASRAGLSPATSNPAAAARWPGPAAQVRRWWLRGSIADPRIEKRVGQVDQQIDQRVDEAEHQNDTLDHRIVATQNRIDGQSAETRNGKYAFG